MTEPCSEYLYYGAFRLYVLVISRTCFSVNPHSVKELLARNKRKIWSLSDCNWTRIYNHLVRKGKPNHLAKLAEWLSFVCEYLFVLCILSECSCHVRYAFESESILYSYLNAKELLAWSRCKIWILSDWNFTGTQNHLVRKRALNHFAKLAKSLSCVASTYLYGAFWLYVVLISCTRFWVNPHSIVAWISTNSLLKAGEKT